MLGEGDEALSKKIQPTTKRLKLKLKLSEDKVQEEDMKSPRRGSTSSDEKQTSVNDSITNTEESLDERENTLDNIASTSIATSAAPIAIKATKATAGPVITASMASMATTTAPITTTAPNTNIASTARNTNIASTTSTPLTPVIKASYYYSLNRDSLKHLFNVVFKANELSALCTTARVPGYARWMNKRMMVDLLIDYVFALKNAMNIDTYNEFTACVTWNQMVRARLPRLPDYINALPLLTRSMQLTRSFTRPTLPFRTTGAVKEVTGTVFLEASGVENYWTDLFFSVPASLPAGSVVFLCLYQCSRRSGLTEAAESPLANLASIASTGNPENDAEIISRVMTGDPLLVSPALIDLTLNDVVLDVGDRYRGHPVYNVSAYCNNSQPNRLRILKHETHQNISNLVLEIIYVVPQAPLAQPNPARGMAIGKTMGYVCLESEPVVKDSKAILNGFKAAVDADVALADDVITISTKCPISFGRIKEPVRFSTCQHAQCFDYRVWKEFTMGMLARASRSIVCPVCCAQITSQVKLIKDGLFNEILGKVEAAVEYVKVDLNTGAFEAVTNTAEADEIGSDNDSDGEGGLKRKILSGSFDVDFGLSSGPSNPSVTVIDLCDSDDEHGRIITIE